MRRKILKYFVLLCFLVCFLPITVNAASEQTAEETYSIFDVKIPFANVYDCYRTTDVSIGWSQKVYKFDYPYNAVTDKAINQEVPDAAEHPENYYYQFTEEKNGKIGLVLHRHNDSDFQKVLSNEGAILNYGDGCFLFHTNGGYGTFVSIKEEPYHRHASDDCKMEHKAGNDTCVRCMVTKSGKLFGKCGERYTVEYLHPDMEQLKKLPAVSGMITINEMADSEDAEKKAEIKYEILKDHSQIAGISIIGESSAFEYDEKEKQLKIVKSGTYEISNDTAADVTLCICAPEVILKFNGVDIDPDYGPAIKIDIEETEESAANQGTIFILNKDTVNRLTANGGDAFSAIENGIHHLKITCDLTDEKHTCTESCGKMIAAAKSVGGTGIGGNVTISGGVIEAIGNSGPGIGGYWADGSNILISGGMISSNGIGANGGYSNAENIVISGGTIETTYIGGGKYGKTEVIVEPKSNARIAVCDGIKHRFARNIKGSPFSERTDISEMTRRATYIKIMEK